MMVKISLTSSGDRPSDGSSSSRSFGRLIKRAADREHLLLAARQQVRRAWSRRCSGAAEITVDALQILRHAVAVAAQVGPHG